MTPGLVAKVRLARSDNIGPRTYRALIRRFGSPEAALDALPELARRGGRLKGVAVPEPGPIEDEITALVRLGGTMIACDDPAYPTLLDHIHDPPPVLSVLGRDDLLARPMVGIVGARNASAGGRRFAERLAADLAEAGQVVVSGMARGIDTAAHTGALDGGTVAVLAGGIDNIYPPENEALYQAIAEQGLVVSDQPLGLVPRSGHFPRRNRIVAGMALGVVVVEATERSGALITARLAAENGRDVFAVPGSPQDPRAKGANRLIRDGAALIEGTEDILSGLQQPVRAVPDLEALTVLPEEDDQPIDIPESGSDDGRERLVSALGAQPVEVDELVRRCQVTPAEAQILLLELELAGRIERLPGNRVALVMA
ncbi:MAG: DNA-protecting protein DprA [Rhodospirillales bacterium]|nr:DNA-protecting protein DprA [Rhodospirillales bacterium]